MKSNSSRKHDKLLKNTPVGILLGAIWAFCLAAILDDTVVKNAFNFPVYIISAFITLVGASLALVGVFASIDNQNSLQERQRRNKFLSAKAFFPMAISSFVKVCQAGVRLSHEEQYYRELHGSGFKEHSLSLLNPKDQIMFTVFRDIIEYSDDIHLVERMSLMMREYQIFLARWERGLTDTDMVTCPGDIRQRTVAWAYLAAIAMTMFDVARGNTDELEKTDNFEEVLASFLRSAPVGVWAEDLSDEVGLYSRTFERRTSPRS